MKCKTCGTELTANQTCPQCGTTAPAFEAPLPPPIPPQYMVEATIPQSYKPLSPWAYYGLQLLFSIPLVGFICLIVFSFDNGNIHRRNFARSYWCALLIQVILIVLIVVLVLVLNLDQSIVEQVQTLPVFS